MRDGALLRAVKALARTRYWIDVRVTRWIQGLAGEPHYQLEGACRACGQCCVEPAIRVPRLAFHLPLTRRALLWWHRAVNGLELVSLDRRTSSMTFRCSHLDPGTHLCDSYGSRPGLCRDYPRNHLHAVSPQLFPGCGYRIVLRNAERFRRALDRVDLTPAQRLELERRLHLVSEAEAHEPPAPPPSG